MGQIRRIFGSAAQQAQQSGWVSGWGLAAAAMGATVGYYVRPGEPFRGAYGTVLGLAAGWAFGAHMARTRAATQGLGKGDCGCGGTPDAGMRDVDIPYPPDGLGSLGKPTRMKAEAWKDGSKSWIDVTPKWPGRKMRITHQFLGV